MKKPSRICDSSLTLAKRNRWADYLDYLSKRSVKVCGDKQIEPFSFVVENTSWRDQPFWTKKAGECGNHLILILGTGDKPWMEIEVGKDLRPMLTDEKVNEIYKLSIEKVKQKNFDAAFEIAWNLLENMVTDPTLWDAQTLKILCRKKWVSNCP